MPLHHDLLNLARQMVDRNSADSLEAELRRAVSTAYYAVFHLLIHEGTNRLVAMPSLRPRVARTFDHKFMSAVCKEFAGLPPDSAGVRVHSTGVVIPNGIVTIASEFVALQDSRMNADYNTATSWHHFEAEAQVAAAELAFAEWIAVQSDPGTDLFLAELWCRGIPKRS